MKNFQNARIKKLSGIFCAVLLFLTAGYSKAAASITYPLDSSTVKASWEGKKVTGAHHGSLSLKSGEIVVSNSNIVGGKFVVDMNSLTCEDIKDTKTADKLIGHLKSDDFFSVEKNPTSTFVIKSVKKIKDSGKGFTHEIAGDLTVKGQTQPTSFPAKVNINKDGISAEGTLTVDRTLYDIRYGSGKFFDIKKLGDKMIDDKFTVSIQFAAKNKAKN